jgi:hypothetical protein
MVGVVLGATGVSFDADASALRSSAMARSRTIAATFVQPNLLIHSVEVG